MCDGDLQRKLNGVASPDSLLELLKVFFVSADKFVHLSVYFFCSCVCVSLCVFPQAYIHEFESWGVCGFTMGVECRKNKQSETGFHPFPALVSECLGQ